MTEPADSETLSLTLVFDERERARIRDLADEVTDPDHPRYGQHLDRDALRDLVRLSEDERQTVVDWVRENGMSVLDSPGVNPQLLFIRASQAQVLAAFGSDVRHWLHKTRDLKGVTRQEIALPRRLAGYIQKVGGLPGERGHFDPHPHLEEELVDEPPPMSVVAPPLQDGVGGVTPADVARLYDIPDAWDGRGETIGLLMFGGALDRSDLRKFWRAHGIEREDPDIVHIGPASSRAPHPAETIEATGSVQWAGAMAPGARIVVYYVDPTVMGDPWSAWLFEAIDDHRRLRPTVLSTSWLTPEREYYRLHGHRVITGLLNQATALGITVIAASGDWGVFDGIPRTTRDGRHVCDAPWPHGTFPAVEERVLGVGGTMVPHLHPLTELGWSAPSPPGWHHLSHFELWASSGGFSDDVPIPAWQRDSLKPFYARDPFTPSVIPYGRGFPDVALMAAGPAVQRTTNSPLSSLGYRLRVGGEWLDYGGGTSIGAPIWAAIVARINDARRRVGLPRLASPNPLFYRLARDASSPFRAITEGQSEVALNVVNHHGRAMTYRMPGYRCGPGWNPVTGLGVPMVRALIARCTTACAGRR